MIFTNFKDFLRQFSYCMTKNGFAILRAYPLVGNVWPKALCTKNDKYARIVVINAIIYMHFIVLLYKYACIYIQLYA